MLRRRVSASIQRGPCSTILVQASRAFTGRRTDLHAKGVDELRTGKQRAGVDIGGDFADGPVHPASLRVSIRKRKIRSPA